MPHTSILDRATVLRLFTEQEWRIASIVPSLSQDSSLTSTFQLMSIPSLYHCNIQAMQLILSNWRNRTRNPSLQATNHEPFWSQIHRTRLDCVYPKLTLENCWDGRGGSNCSTSRVSCTEPCAIKRMLRSLKVSFSSSPFSLCKLRNIEPFIQILILLLLLPKLWRSSVCVDHWCCVWRSAPCRWECRFAECSWGWHSSFMEW